MNVIKQSTASGGRIGTALFVWKKWDLVYSKEQRNGSTYVKSQVRLGNHALSALYIHESILQAYRTASSSVQILQTSIKSLISVPYLLTLYFAWGIEYPSVILLNSEAQTASKHSCSQPWKLCCLK